ncbi:hypothetical protein ACX12E_10475 [Paenibacillus vandeheii]
MLKIVNWHYKLRPSILFPSGKQAEGRGFFYLFTYNCCKDCKKIAGKAINELLSPFRERRQYYEQRGHEVKEILVEGTRQARRAARETMLEVREAMGIRYFD